MNRVRLSIVFVADAARRSGAKNVPLAPCLGGIGWLPEWRSRAALLKSGSFRGRRRTAELPVSLSRTAKADAQRAARESRQEAARAEAAREVAPLVPKRVTREMMPEQARRGATPRAALPGLTETVGTRARPVASRSRLAWTAESARPASARATKIPQILASSATSRARARRTARTLAPIAARAQPHARRKIRVTSTRCVSRMTLRPARAARVAHAKRECAR